MKTLTNRFAILAVLGTMLCSALVVGCGGGDEEESTTTNNTTTTTTKEDAGDE